jgi:hypothetical protein
MFNWYWNGPALHFSASHYNVYQADLDTVSGINTSAVLVGTIDCRKNPTYKEFMSSFRPVEKKTLSKLDLIMED